MAGPESPILQGAVASGGEDREGEGATGTLVRCVREDAVRRICETAHCAAVDFRMPGDQAGPWPVAGSRLHYRRCTWVPLATFSVNRLSGTRAL